MDTDWCLNCNRRTDGLNAYCSDECKKWAGPSSPVQPPRPSRSSPVWPFVDDDKVPRPRVSWVGHGRAGIRAWASMIPQCPTRKSTEDDGASLSAVSSASSLRPPKLLCRQRPASPTLCMSTLTPATPLPSKSPASQRQNFVLISKLIECTGSASTGSLSSTMTESLIATPPTRAGPIEKQKELHHTFSDDSIGEKRSAHHPLLKPPYMDNLHIHIISSF